MDLILLVRIILFVLLITSIAFFVAMARVKWRMHKNHKATGYPDAHDWVDGYPPPDIPRSWIVEGMRLDEKDPCNPIPTWKFNSKYYQSLL